MKKSEVTLKEKEQAQDQNSKITVNLSIIIKRLELIKNLIALEEEEEIVEQISKIENLEINHTVNKIINTLKQKSYSKATREIEEFINSNNQVAFYIDTEVQALRFEAKSLERQIQDLSNEKAELDKLIHEFSIRHSKELGELIIKILQHRKEKSKGTPKEEEAEKDYQEYNTNYQATKKEKVAILTEEEQKDLINKYRKASKLCHPDVVDEDQKETAHNIFMELNAAYEKNDLKRVAEILEELQQGKAFTSKADTANEKSILRAELERLRNRLSALSAAITTIKLSDTFVKILNIKNWDEYFLNTKQQLEEQLNQLDNERK